MAPKKVSDDGDAAARQAPKKVKKQKKKDGEEDLPEKLPSMRTSMDCVQRIMWDSDLDASEFTIGYLDRFLGIIEKPFSAFSWEDLDRVDLFTLAIPKHRIEYFKFRDIVVWDKSKRLDDIFGSRGGRHIEDIVREWREKHGYTSAKINPIAECVAAQEEPVTSQSSEDRPNFFVCIRLSNPEIISSAQRVQEAVIDLHPELRAGATMLSALHVTLCMVRVPEERQREACDAIRALKPVLTSLTPASFEIGFEGVRDFRGRVIYAAPTPASVGPLLALSTAIRTRLCAAGIMICDSDNFTPHATLIKINKSVIAASAKTGTPTIPPESYSAFSKLKFGEESVRAVHLCRVESLPYVDPASRRDVFYETVASVANPKHASRVSVILNLVLHSLKSKFEEGDETVAEIQRLIESGTKFDLSAAASRLRLIIWSRVSADERERAICVVARGLPGSGKTTVVEAMARAQRGTRTKICSADSFMVDGDGSYRFEYARLAEVHDLCQAEFSKALARGTQTILLDNTHGEVAMYASHVEVAKLLGWSTRAFEIRCADFSDALKFSERGIHKVPVEIYSKMMSRWEPDVSSILVDAIFPVENGPVQVPSDLVDALLFPPSRLGLRRAPAVECVFVGAFLEPQSRRELLRWIPPIHRPEGAGTIHADHVTLRYRPNKTVLSHLPVGDRLSVDLIAVASDRTVQAAAVNLSPNLLPVESGRTAHVTISTAAGFLPNESNRLFESGAAKRWGGRRISLCARVGIFLKFKSGIGIRVFDPAEARYLGIGPTDEISPRFAEIQLDEKPDESIEYVNIFDFDGTLLETPSAEKGIPAWKKQNGCEWPYGRAWVSRGESLCVRGLIRPGRALSLFRKAARGSATVKNFVVTGRHDPVREHVESCLFSADIFPDEICTRPVLLQTEDHKAQTLSQILHRFPCASVTIIEDSPDSMKSYAKIALENIGRAVKIVDVATLPAAPISGINVVKDSMKFRGRDGSDEDICADETAAKKILQECWYLVASEALGDVLAIESERACLCLPFGSRPLGRPGDIDMTLLLPSSLPLSHASSRLEDLLRLRGADRIYSAIDARVPRMKVRMCLDTPTRSTVELDLSFATVPADTLQFWFSSYPPENRNIETLTAALGGRGMPAATEMALEGPRRLGEMEKRLSFVGVPVEEFGLLLDVVSEALRVRGLRCNALHCIRTFHLAEGIMRALETSTNAAEILRSPTSDNLLPHVLHHLAEIPTEIWHEICGIWVPVAFLTQSRDALKSLAPAAPLSHEFLDSLLLTGEPVEFPPKNFTDVFVAVEGVGELAWKICTNVEARLPGGIRKAIERGVPIIPGPLRGGEVARFAVADSWRGGVQLVKEELAQVWRQVQMYRDEATETDGKVEVVLGVGPEEREIVVE